MALQNKLPIVLVKNSGRTAYEICKLIDKMEEDELR